MLPYFALLIVSFLFCFVAKGKTKGKIVLGKNEWVSANNWGIYIFFFILWALLSCRSEGIGNDTANYKHYFDVYNSLPFKQVLKKDGVEVLYRLLNWLVGRFTDNFQMFLTIVAAITVIPIALLYGQDRRHSYLKIILFLNMSVFVILFSGIRQSVAMSIGLIAFYFVKKQKPVAFLITAALAMGIHQSAFMLFAMYPLYCFRLKKRHLYVIVPLIAVVYVFNVQIFGVLTSIMQLFTTRYEEAAYSYNGAVMMIILFFLFTLFAYIIPDGKKEDDEFIGMRNYLLLATLLQCFAPIHVLAMRMNYYYILFVPMVVPMVLDYADKRWKQVARIAEICMCVFFTGYFIIGIIKSMGTGGALHTVPYMPFWKA